MKIRTEARIYAPIRTVWNAFNDADHILRWDQSAEWRTTLASNDLRVGGQLKLRIDPRQDGPGFDFAATYTTIEPLRLIEWVTADGRHVSVSFREAGEGVLVRQAFDAEPSVPADAQRRDWQDVLDGFARYAASL